MNEITKLDTVQHYCDLFGIEALHPLISIVDCDKMPPHSSWTKTLQSLCDLAERYGLWNYELRKKHIRL